MSVPQKVVLLARHNGNRSFRSLIHRHDFLSVTESSLGRNQAQARFASSASKKSAKKKENTFSVLFGKPLPNPESRSVTKKWKFPRSIAGWRRAFSNAWAEYCYTWEGFFSNVSSSDEKEKEAESTKSEIKKKLKDQTKVVKGNVKRNVEFVTEEAPKFFGFLQDKTKIYTMDDFKAWAGEQLKLATECLAEFMAGYRTGRDGEVDKMLNEYFNEKGDEKPKRKRRKPKRLVRA